MQVNKVLKADIQINKTNSMISGSIGVVSGIVELIAGFMGVKAMNLSVCKILGIIIIVISIAAAVIGFFLPASTLTAGGNSTKIISLCSSLVLGLVLPILYLSGVKKQENQ